MCKVRLSKCSSEEQLLNTIILNQRRRSFDKNEIVVIARKVGISDFVCVDTALCNLGRKGLLVRVGKKYYVKPIVRHRVASKLTTKKSSIAVADY